MHTTSKSPLFNTYVFRRMYQNRNRTFKSVLVAAVITLQAVPEVYHNANLNAKLCGLSILHHQITKSNIEVPVLIYPNPVPFRF